MDFTKMASSLVDFARESLKVMNQKLLEMTTEEKAMLIDKVEINNLVELLQDKHTGSFVTKEDYLNIAIILGNAGLKAMEFEIKKDKNEDGK